MKGNVSDSVGRCFNVDKSLGLDQSTIFSLFTNESGNSNAQAGFSLSPKEVNDVLFSYKKYCFDYNNICTVGIVSD